MVYEASDLVTIVKKGGRAEVAWMASGGAFFDLDKVCIKKGAFGLAKVPKYAYAKLKNSLFLWFRFLRIGCMDKFMHVCFRRTQI